VPAGIYSDQENVDLYVLQKHKSIIGRLDLELTERCNNNCIHCCINLPSMDARVKARELGTDDWKAILRQAAEVGVISVRLTGGEPLLREDFPELYLYARHLGLRVILFTNGRLISPTIAELLAKYPALERIEITVYGMHQESYEAVSRMPGSYEEFRLGVERLLTRRIPFMVKGSLLPPNRKEVEEFNQWAATIPWMHGSPSLSLFFELRSRRDSTARNRQITRLRPSPEDGFAFLIRRSQTYRQHMEEFCGRFMAPPSDSLFTCGASRGGCIDAYGKLQLCMALRHPDYVFDMKTGTLKEALSTTFPPYLLERATNSDYLRRCAKCFLRGLCEQCPGKSWSEHGTLDHPVDYLCQLAHIQARYLGLLSESEMAWEVTDWQKRVQALTKGAPAK